MAASIFPSKKAAGLVAVLVLIAAISHSVVKNNATYDDLEPLANHHPFASTTSNDELASRDLKWQNKWQNKNMKKKPWQKMWKKKKANFNDKKKNLTNNIGASQAEAGSSTNKWKRPVAQEVTIGNNNKPKKADKDAATSGGEMIYFQRPKQEPPKEANRATDPAPEAEDSSTTLGDAAKLVSAKHSTNHHKSTHKTAKESQLSNGKSKSKSKSKLSRSSKMNDSKSSKGSSMKSKGSSGTLKSHAKGSSAALEGDTLATPKSKGKGSSSAILFDPLDCIPLDEEPEPSSRKMKQNRKSKKKMMKKGAKGGMRKKKKDIMPQSRFLRSAFNYALGDEQDLETEQRLLEHMDDTEDMDNSARIGAEERKRNRAQRKRKRQGATSQQSNFLATDGGNYTVYKGHGMVRRDRKMMRHGRRSHSGKGATIIGNDSSSKGSSTKSLSKSMGRTGKSGKGKQKSPMPVSYIVRSCNDDAG